METIEYTVDGFKNVKEAILVLKTDALFDITEQMKGFPNAVAVGNNGLRIRLIPENITVSQNAIENAAGNYWSVSIRFNIPVQKNEKLKALLSFHNQEVILFLKTESEVFIYGNPLEHLRFLIKEVNPKKTQQLFGYEITVKGAVTIPPKIANTLDFDID